jgi:putative iron-dependent peroxidase
MGAQKAVLEPPPLVARALAFDMQPGADPRSALPRLTDGPCPAHGVLGFGLPLLLALKKSIDGLRAFPAIAGPGCAFPSTQGALWAYLGANTESDVHEHAGVLRARLGASFTLREEVRCFRYRDGRDLSGYIDGTANPVDSKALKAAIVSGRGPGLDGSSFVAVQRWVHTLTHFSKLDENARDLIIGRRLRDNEEIPDAPPSAHVKRAEQEAYDPPAFMVRRSMPWAADGDEGLYFVAYGESLGPFERVLERMSGAGDGITDGLLTFSRAVTGGYYWCPPTRDDRLDLSLLA